MERFDEARLDIEDDKGMQNVSEDEQINFGKDTNILTTEKTQMLNQQDEILESNHHSDTLESKTEEEAEKPPTKKEIEQFVKLQADELKELSENELENLLLSKEKSLEIIELKL